MESRLGVSSPIREAYERAERLKSQYGSDAVFDFSIGNPTAPCPAGVRAALARTLELSTPAAHGYMHDRGYEQARSAVADSLNARFGASYDSDCIVMTTGAACALNVLMLTMLDRDDEVVGFLPCYPAYRSFAENWGGRFVEVPFDPRTLLPDLDAFGAALSKRTKIVLVNSPNNPTGLVYPEELARRIAEILGEWRAETGNDVMLVSDEPYRELVYDGAQTPWWPAFYDNTAVVYSWSKSTSIAGERIGYLALSPNMPDRDLVRRGVCRALGDVGFVNAPATAQRMAMQCVDDIVDIGYYDANRRLLYEGLRAAGFDPVYGNGAFYLLLPAPDGDEEGLIARLADERIVVVGGSAFGCPGYVRLSYCLGTDAIRDALPGFAAAARSYGASGNAQSISEDNTDEEKK